MSKFNDQNLIPLHDPVAFRRRFKSRKRTIESFEAHANIDRSPTEKLADLMTSRLGSMGFLIINVIWFSSWILINTGHVPSIRIFDPFPFGLLTMIVSLEAIFLAIIVLISQNRAAKIDDLRDEIDLHINTIAEEEITKTIELLILLLKKNNIDVSKDLELKQMLEPTNTENIQQTLKKQVG
ncbi:hypothetical protein A2334_01850 [Candidatus Roizmanbacteria bacterium RIFOXYB2_FULL_38_10]|uniref:DUF1003 domain-containing protein n=1 Tax=Candidatus Roizmanbacteria bacterium RIFOXYD1_FULL_38_12 TaxID=1802093 RepID=A0A1F7L237_9BACT|nr:MAG: hypothetical protein A3K47_05270 [Candidatus Roizmanbacteria bacterium RIFOXYA2_FULL_38_14]OGK64156.1 MAG: hypothetical protein A3K27_05270 [Candidatus Roizmanbacteria bacterium RIFOXYA1_FULL_37_12]OGK66002.1 MAG: hypothetical protein A3K38_05270 [Candidatus Roizmanbacteria bacterium RIFOXYB1_FULL_40_23]OGK67758.1 MAG: hypothetical protein A2334_01850 [Candidatus Roizmanbacteria bacterium RIFOXYB2_FULL_38_10]OGK70407.1 MAG: hypothetical protein A3K21_05275 [Candidatus Roizmanbacteria ba